MNGILHPTPEELLANAAGTDTDGARCVVAVHVAACRDCRCALLEMNLFAALLLEEQAPAPFRTTGRIRAFEAAAFRRRRSTREHVRAWSEGPGGSR